MRFTFLHILLIVWIQQSYAQELNIQYASYFGGSGEDFPIQSTSDATNHVYVVGYTESDDFPTTSGAHQETFGGGSSDGFIMKFNPDHTLAWSTYFGGENVDVINDIAIYNDIIYMIGYTYSSSGVVNGNFGTTSINGIGDGMIIAMTPNGETIWSGYVGGNSDDFLNGLTTDQNGNIYVVGGTQSSSGITTSDAFQQTIQGLTDGWVAKMNDNGEVVWSSYFGGMGIDRFNDICETAVGNFACVGKTSSDDLYTTANAHQQNIAGNGDGMFCMLNSSGSPLYSTYIGGDAQDDLQKIISFNGKLAGIGNTSSQSGLITGTNPFQTDYGGSLQDGFQLSFDELTLDLGISYIGGDGFDECHSLYVKENQLWIAMSTSSINLPYDASFENEGWGMSDAYFIAFNDNFVRIYSGYIRGIYPDNAKTLVVSDHIRIFGNNYLLSDYTTPNAYSSEPAGMGDLLYTVLSNPLNLAEHAMDKTLVTYPNPCSNVIHIDLPKDDWKIQVFDSQGRLQQEVFNSNSTHQNIHTNAMSSGVYHIRCIGTRSTYTGTLMKE